MDSLKRVAEQFKEKTGRDLMKEITKVEETVPVLDEEIWDIAKHKLQTLLDEYESFYALKGRGIEVTIRILKDGYGNTHEENFEYSDKIKLKFVAEIGSE